MTFINEPQFVALDSYKYAIDKMLGRLTLLPGLLAIYQIGGINDLGISDLDIVAIFEDGTSISEDPRESLNKTEQYLFSHPLFAMNRSMFLEGKKYTFFHNFNLLWGRDVNKEDDFVHTRQQLIMMQGQWAREFLVKMCLNMTVESEFKVYKVHSLLLHGRALSYDLEFLKEDPINFRACIDQINAWRKIWFTNRPSNAEILSLIESLHTSLCEFIEEHFSGHPFYLPNLPVHKLGRNVTLKNSASVQGVSKGIKVPFVPHFAAKKIISLQHRLNEFELSIPFTTQNTPSFLDDSFSYTHRVWEHNRQQLPYFMPLASNLIINKT